jgi:hypothetical protein
MKQLSSGDYVHMAMKQQCFGSDLAASGHKISISSTNKSDTKLSRWSMDEQ